MTTTKNLPRTAVHVTAEDERELRKTIRSAKDGRENRDSCLALESRLREAIVIESWHMPRNIVTMNSRIALVDRDTSERSVFTLVYPGEESSDDAKVSVFSPLGAAILGAHTGDEVEWTSPTGRRVAVVEKVIDQPEAKRRYRLSRKYGF